MRKKPKSAYSRALAIRSPPAADARRNRLAQQTCDNPRFAATRALCEAAISASVCFIRRAILIKQANKGR